MLDDRSCLVSGAVPRVCEQEGKWVYMRYSFIEVPNGKRRLEDDDEVDVFGMRKSLKRLQQKHGAEGISPTLHNLFPARPEDGLNQQSYDRDQFGMNCDFTWLVEGRELNLSKRLDDLELSLSNMKERRARVNGELSLGDEKEDLGWKRTTAQLLELHEKDLTLTMNDLHLSSANRSDKKYHNRNRVDAKGKRPVENGRRETLLSKQSDMTEKEEMTLSLNDLRLSPADQSDQQFHFGYQMDMKGKRRLEGGEEELLGKRKSSKRLDLHVRDEVTHVLHDLALSSVEPLDQEDSERDQADTSSLIQFLGRDISIHCLLHCSRSDYNLLASLNRSFRNLIRTGELYKLRRKVAIVEHWVYFSCDVHKWEAFDPIRRRWMHLPRMPSNDCFSCSDKESLAVGTELLVFGKEITSHVIWKYSILSNSWSSGMVMNAPRCLFGSASLGEIAILAGGCDSKGKVLSSAELYNSETGTWEILPSMKKPRKMCSGVFMDGKFYVIGGSNTELLNCGEEYNLDTRTWREIPNMCPRRTGPTEAPPLVAVVNNELYAADYAERELMKYNKETISWDTVGRLPERAASMNGWGLAFRACGKQLIVIGGPRAMGGGIIELNSWIPREGPPQWNLLATKQSGNFVYNCAVMGC